MVDIKNTNDSSEERIRQAAIKVFTGQGLAGARMQDIADEAGINKAMLHYYFGSKQQLFEIVFAEKLRELFSAFGVILNSGLSFEEKIQAFVATQTEMMLKYPGLPMFVLNEVRRNPGILDELFADGGPKFLKGLFKDLIETEIREGRIKPIPFEQFLVNLLSLCMYPIIAKPVLQFVLDADEQAFAQLMLQRKEMIPALMLNTMRQ